MNQAQAHAVLDAVRAAAQVSGSGVAATAPVALAGYSQGGGAAAAAAELAPSGTLRAGVNLSNFLLVTGTAPSGDPVGVSPDMARAIAGTAYAR